VAIDNVWAPEVEKWLWDHACEVVVLDGALDRRERVMATYEPKPSTKHVFVLTNLEAARITPINKIVDGKKTQEWTMKRGRIAVPGPTVGDHSKVSFPMVGPAIPQLFRREWDTIIVDEAHRALIRKTGPSSQIRGGFKRLRSRRRIALSGTPMRGKPEQLWGTLNWLYPDVYTSYWKWVAKYFQIMSTRHSDFVLGEFLPGGEDRLHTDHKHLILRRTKEEVAPELPPKTYYGRHLIPGDPQSPVGVWLPQTEKQARQLRTLDLDGVVLADEGEIFANGTLAVDTRRKQLAHGYHEIVNGKMVPTTDSPKLAWLLDWLDNANGEQIVVASQFTSVLDVYTRELREKGYTVALLTGKTGKTARNAGIEGFKKGEIQVFCLNTAAGGVALTLDVADYLVMLDETFIPDDQEQVEDRIHRVSRIHNVTIYYLRTLGTIEEEVALVTSARYDVMAYLLDGARGVESARRLYMEKKGAV
jgi:SNF2 family DNA or RNA helicase